MVIQVDVDAVNQEIEAKKQDISPRSRERAIEELSDVLEPSMTLEKFYGYIHVLAGKSSNVRENLNVITIGEVIDPRGSLRKAALRSTSRRGHSRRTYSIEALKNEIMSTVTPSGVDTTELLTSLSEKFTPLSKAVLSSALRELADSCAISDAGGRPKVWTLNVA